MVTISLNTAFKTVNKDIITSHSKTHVVGKIGTITAMGQTQLTVLHGDVLIIQLYLQKAIVELSRQTVLYYLTTFNLLPQQHFVLVN